jgi:hypothetical protein
VKAAAKTEKKEIQMKSSIVRSLVTLGLSAILSPVALLAQDNITATIPFDFFVGGKSFAAGDYSIHRLNEGVLKIQKVKDGTGVFAMVMTTDKTSNSRMPVLLFNRYGDRYFLSKVSGEDRGWQLHPSNVEKELISKVASPKPVVVAAALRSK